LDKGVSGPTVSLGKRLSGPHSTFGQDSGPHRDFGQESQWAPQRLWTRESVGPTVSLDKRL